MFFMKEALVELAAEYNILEEIGSGTFGTVYSGKCLKTNAFVAIKSIMKKNVVNFINSIPIEIYILKELNNTDGVCHLINYIECINGYIIIMEYSLESMDLHDYWIQNLPLLVSQVKTIILQIINTCIRLFKLRIYHGDLKMENIIIYPETLTVKLIDFGGAGFFNQKNYICGTQFYYPPEYRSKKIYDIEAAHVWAIGVILFELVSGKKVDSYIYEKDTDLLEHINDDCIEFYLAIKKCLNFNYKSRIKMNDVLHIIENVII